MQVVIAVLGLLLGQDAGGPHASAHKAITIRCRQWLWRAQYSYGIAQSDVVETRHTWDWIFGPLPPRSRGGRHSKVRTLTHRYLDLLRRRGGCARRRRLHAALAVPDKYGRGQHGDEQASAKRKANREAGAGVLGCHRVARSPYANAWGGQRRRWGRRGGEPRDLDWDCDG